MDRFERGPRDPAMRVPIQSHNPQFDESALERWGGEATDENTKRDRSETECRRGTQLTSRGGVTWKAMLATKPMRI